MSKEYDYKGWDYYRGNNLVRSKRHIFHRSAVFSICGRANPYHINSFEDEGEGLCKACEKIAHIKGIIVK